jgi:hypothetical protein
VWRSINHHRTIADGVVTVQIRVIIAAGTVIVITVTPWIITPTWVAGSDEERGGEIAAAITIAITVAGTVAGTIAGAVRPSDG